MKKLFTKLIAQFFSNQKPVTQSIFVKTLNFKKDDFETIYQCFIDENIPAQNNGQFTEKARQLFQAVLKALVELRDKGEIELSSAVIMEHLTIDHVIELMQRKDLSELTHSLLKDFMTSMGYSHESNQLHKISMQEQFGYARALLMTTCFTGFPPLVVNSESLG